MSFELALAARLLWDAGVAAIVGQRVDWDRMPQGGALPRIVLVTIADARPQTMKAFQIDRPTPVQIDCYAETKPGVLTLREAVLRAVAPPMTIEGVRFQRAQDIVIRPDFGRTEPGRTEKQERYREIIELTLWHNG